MRKFGLIGRKLEHSFSPKYFKSKFELLQIDHKNEYQAYPLRLIEEVIPLLEELNGLNVTIPYKEAIIPYLDDLSEAATDIGAVNTIKRQGGKTIGYNTDAFGFEASLKPLLMDIEYSALVLGTGGASKAVTYVLDKLSIDWTYVSRSSPHLKYEDLTEKMISQNLLIINTTPLGMYPHEDGLPQLPYQAISEKHILYDLIYNPEKTLFLNAGSQAGASIKNGMEMLQLQAEKAWEIWNE